MNIIHNTGAGLVTVFIKKDIKLTLMTQEEKYIYKKKEASVSLP